MFRLKFFYRTFFWFAVGVFSWYSIACMVLTVVWIYYKFFQHPVARSLLQYQTSKDPLLSRQSRTQVSILRPSRLLSMIKCYPHLGFLLFLISWTLCFVIPNFVCNAAVNIFQAQSNAFTQPVGIKVIVLVEKITLISWFELVLVGFFFCVPFLRF